MCICFLCIAFLYLCIFCLYFVYFFSSSADEAVAVYDRNRWEALNLDMQVVEKLSNNFYSLSQFSRHNMEMTRVGCTQLNTGDMGAGVETQKNNNNFGTIVENDRVQTRTNRRIFAPLLKTS